MTFKDYIEVSREKIGDCLTEFLSLQKQEGLPPSFTEQKLIDSLESFALRGKFIRGTLFLLILEGLGIRVEKKHYNIACAIELMHSALLIQDDVIDKDRLRRGATTVFAQYEKEGKELGAYDPYHYGVSTAMMVADVAFFFAIELIAEFNDPSLSKLLKFYAHEVYFVAVAESVDSIFGQTGREPEESEIYAVYRYKTARYTFSLPFVMAAIAAGANDATKDSLASLGEDAGIIFQLKDDEIGLFGDEKVVGKPVGSDIRENKKTIIRHLLYKHADPPDRKILDECFGNPNAGEDEIGKVRTLYERYNIKGLIDLEIEQLMEKVWQNYNALGLKEEQKEILKGLLEYNLTRSY